MCNNYGKDHGHAGDHFAHANKHHFDTTAHEYDNIPGARELTADLAQIMLKTYTFDPASTEVMEFACGTGLISKQLAPHCKSILGVDISQAMVDQYHKKAESNMKAIATELKGVEGELDNAKFDVIICSSAYHHFSSISDITQILSFFLKPQGVLLVTDMYEFTTTGSKGLGAYGDIVPHIHGFKKEVILETFEGAGLKDVSVEFAMQAPKVMFGQASGEVGEVNIFIAKGTK